MLVWRGASQKSARLMKSRISPAGLLLDSTTSTSPDLPRVMKVCSVAPMRMVSSSTQTCARELRTIGCAMSSVVPTWVLKRIPWKPFFAWSV